MPVAYRGERAELRSRLLTVERERCSESQLLDDHLQSLQDLAERAGHRLGFARFDATAGDLEPHRRDPV